MASSKLSVTIASESGVIFFDEVEALFVPSKQGTIAILQSHTPTIMKLEPGEVGVRQDHKNASICKIREGLLKVENNEAVVLVVESK